MTDDAEEPRVRDLLRRDDGDESDLMAWFERPSFAHLAELAAGMPAQPPPPPSVQDEKMAAAIKRRDAAIAHVDPRLLAHILRHDDVHISNLPPPLPGFDERPAMMRFDEAAVPAIPDLDNWPVRERGDVLDDALKVSTPQAFLRDLHRPVKDFEILHESAFADLPEQVTLDAHTVAVREAMTTGTRQHAFPAALRHIAEDSADRRSLMTRPWADAKSARGKKREAELLGKEAEAVAVPSGPEPSP